MPGVNENIKLKDSNFTREDGYFYYINSNADALFKITDDGTVAFSYPLDTDISNTVKTIEYAAGYFFTLEAPTTTGILVKRWVIDDYILKLNKTYSLPGSPTQRFYTETMAIEHFDRTFGATANSGVNTLYLNDNSRILPGDILYLGPSSFTGFEGLTERITVLSTSGTTQVNLNTNLVNSYNSGNKASFANNCWFFSKFRPSDPSPSGSGQLYSFALNPSTPTAVTRKAGNEFRDVIASSFFNDPVSNRDYLVYMNQTNLLYLETETTHPDFLNNVKSATQNNTSTDSTVLPVYDITSESGTLFRLQQKATFREGAVTQTTDWTPNYNYQLANLRAQAHSISMTASKSIIAADGVSTTRITATLRDQFDNPRGGATISFSEDDTDGAPFDGTFSGSTSLITSGTGQTSIVYRAGVVPNIVKITAEVTQDAE